MTYKLGKPIGYALASIVRYEHRLSANTLIWQRLNHSLNNDLKQRLWHSRDISVELNLGKALK